METPIKGQLMTLTPTAPAISQEDTDGVMRAAHDYIDGYTQGDVDRHGRAYHPECIKRRYVTDPDSGVEALQVLTPRIMVDYAATGTVMPDCEAEVFIDAISEGMASVRIYSCQWVDFLHIVKARGDWKLFHITWHERTSH